MAYHHLHAKPCRPHSSSKTYAKEALWLTTHTSKAAIAQALLQRLYDRVLRFLHASERRIPRSSSYWPSSSDQTR